jgi:hypothetical protein
LRTPGLHTVTRPGDPGRLHPGTAGVVAGLKHSTILPGGDDQCSFTLLTGGPGRPAAIRPGRWLVLSAAGQLWAGRLDEPLPAPGGWQVNAHGQGTMGAQWQAYWTGTYDGDGPIDAAITRGLPWVNGGITASGIDATQIPDPAQPSIADHLTAITDPVTKAWQVDRRGVVATIPLPVTPTRLLILSAPAGRSVADVITRLWIRYQSATDKYATTSVVNQAADDDAGTTERFADFADAGVMTQAAAQSRGTAILAKYTAAGWAGPLTATASHYLTMAGTEVDLACERAGEVVKMIFAGPASEAEWAAGIPPTFIAGHTEYDWDTGTLTIDPLDTVRRSLPDLLTAAARPK